jgi:hypothetical protein
MQNRIKTVEVRDLCVSHVLADVRHGVDFLARCIRAASEKITVIADNRVARLLNHRRHDGADVAHVPGNHDTHVPHLLRQITMDRRDVRLRCRRKILTIHPCSLQAYSHPGGSAQEKQICFPKGGRTAHAAKVFAIWLKWHASQASLGVWLELLGEMRPRAWH